MEWKEVQLGNISANFPGNMLHIYKMIQINIIKE